MAWQLHYQDEFLSPLSPAEVLRRIQASLLPADAPTWRDDYQPAATQFFEGKVTGHTFQLLRYRRQPAGFREAAPYLISGLVTPHGTGSYIRLRYGMFAGGWSLLGFQYALVGSLIIAASVAYGLHLRTFPWATPLLLLGLLAYFLGGMYGSFYQEAVKSRPLFAVLLGLKPAWRL